MKDSIKPSHEAIRAATLNESNQAQDKRHEAATATADAWDVYRAGQDEDRIVREIVSQWRDGGHGFVPEVKPDDVLRLTGENTNSLSLYSPKQWKVKKLCNLNNKYQADGTLLIETGTQWDEAPDSKKPGALFNGSQRCRIEAAHNKNESFGRSQQGGTAVAAFT